MLTPSTVNAPDLFVLLERAFHSRSRNCHGCTFSLPYRVFNSPRSNWAVIPSHSCSPTCQSILEDLVSELQDTYALA
jgi:hypothetical protein